MSAALSYLPYVYAYACGSVSSAAVVLPELGFYRKYTEALLRRYVRLSMEAAEFHPYLDRKCSEAESHRTRCAVSMM